MSAEKDNDPSGAFALTGFNSKETKLLAAALVSSIGIDKYDYELMALLTGNTAGSLKKMLPPVKRKAIDAHASFAAFFNTSSSKITKSAALKAPDKKRKAVTAESSGEDLPSETGKATTNKPATKKLKPIPKIASKGGKRIIPVERAAQDSIEAVDSISGTPKATPKQCGGGKPLMSFTPSNQSLNSSESGDQVL